MSDPYEMAKRIELNNQKQLAEAIAFHWLQKYSKAVDLLNRIRRCYPGPFHECVLAEDIAELLKPLEM